MRPWSSKATIVGAARFFTAASIRSPFGTSMSAGRIGRASAQPVRAARSAATASRRPLPPAATRGCDLIEPPEHDAGDRRALAQEFGPVLGVGVAQCYPGRCGLNTGRDGAVGWTWHGWGTQNPGVGFNPFRQQRRRPTDYVMVAAAF